MDLVLAGLNESPLFRHLPVFNSIVYKGELEPKIRHFETFQGAEKGSLVTYTLIRKEESLLGSSFRDMIEHIAKMTALQLRGFFEWNILSFDLSEGLQGLNAENLVSLLVNKARKLLPLEETDVRYGKIRSILKKRMEENWGKVELAMPLETFHKESFQLDLLVKKLMKTAEPLGMPCRIVIHDLSPTPLFRFGEEMQTERMRKTLEKYKAASQNVLPEIYIVHDNKAVELLEQFQLKSSP